jgi:hypothetical protein
MASRKQFPSIKAARFLSFVQIQLATTQDDTRGLHMIAQLLGSSTWLQSFNQTTPAFTAHHNIHSHVTVVGFSFTVSLDAIRDTVSLVLQSPQARRKFQITCIGPTSMLS